MGKFYAKAIEDDMLAPFFLDELGDDLEDEEWVDHIELLADFWLAKILGHDTYFGNYVGAHVKMPHLQRATFDRWFELFGATADEVYTPEVAKNFKKQAMQLMKHFFASDKKEQLVSGLTTLHL